MIGHKLLQLILIKSSPYMNNTHNMYNVSKTVGHGVCAAK
jgi:hypothetical protein